MKIRSPKAINWTLKQYGYKCINKHAESETESEGFSKSEIFGLGLQRSPRTRKSEKLCNIQKNDHMMATLITMTHGLAHCQVFTYSKILELDFGL
jgi:hypothetical protein